MPEASDDSPVLQACRAFAMVCLKPDSQSVFEALLPNLGWVALDDD